MLFADNARYSYAVNPLIEVICQLDRKSVV